MALGTRKASSQHPSTRPRDLKTQAPGMQSSSLFCLPITVKARSPQALRPRAGQQPAEDGVGFCAPGLSECACVHTGTRESEWM